MKGDVVLSWTDGSRWRGGNSTSCRIKSGGIGSIPFVIVSEQTSAHAKVCRWFTVLSVRFVCLVTLYASEKAVPGHWYLTGSHVSKR
jgi:uncharacterized protein YodC (DUF2158 family)